MDLISSGVSLNLACPDEDTLNMDSVRDSWNAFTSRQLDKVVELEQQVATPQQLLERTKSDLQAMYFCDLAHAAANTQPCTQMSGDNPTISGNRNESDSAGCDVDASFAKAQMERLAGANASLQATINEITGKCRKDELEIERLKASDEFLRNQVSGLEKEIKEKNDKIALLQRDLEDIAAKGDEAVLH